MADKLNVGRVPGCGGYFLLPVLIALVIMLAGCQNARIAGDFCDVSAPHSHSAKAQEAMTDKELAQEVKHNEYGEQACGWKP